MALSSRGALGALVLSLPVLLSACASTQDREVKKLQARSSYEQGIRNLSEKRVSLGMAAIKEAVELDPENATYHNTLGVVLLDLKRPAEAQAAFQAALDVDKNNPEAHHNLGLASRTIPRPTTTSGWPMPSRTGSARPSSPTKRPWPFPPMPRPRSPTTISAMPISGSARRRRPRSRSGPPSSSSRP